MQPLNEKMYAVISLLTKYGPMIHADLLQLHEKHNHLDRFIVSNFIANLVNNIATNITTTNEDAFALATLCKEHISPEHIFSNEADAEGVVDVPDSNLSPLQGGETNH